MSYDISDALTVDDIPGYWGISPEAIVLANNAQQTDSQSAWDSLRRFYDVMVVRSNYKPDWSLYRDTLLELVEQLLTPPLDSAALFCSSQTITNFIAGAAYQQTPSGPARALIYAQEIAAKEADSNEAVVLSRPDLHGYTNEVDRELLKSLRLMRPVETGYAFDKSILATLSMAEDRNRATSAWVLMYRILSTAGLEPDDKIIRLFLDELGEPTPETPVEDPSGSLPVYIEENSLQSLATAFFNDTLDDLCHTLQTTIQNRRHQLQECLRLPDPTVVTNGKHPLPFNGAPATVCALASVVGAPVSTEWLSERTDWGKDPLDIHHRLREHGLEVKLTGGVVTFEKSYFVPNEESDTIDSYLDWVKSQLNDSIERERTFAELGDAFERVRLHQRQAILKRTIQSLGEIQIKPIEFVYTMFDPVHHADQYDIDEYTGNRDELKAEVRRIRRWNKRAPHDSTSFADAIPEVLNYPLEHSDAEPQVRIMSPWINFAIQDYVGLIKQLLENDISVKLLFRHPDSDDWNKLKQNFLSRIGDTGGNLELRTYTRYKSFHTHNELSKVEEVDDKYVSETGVHGKLFIAGGPQNGTVLAGSANLMENSIFYNPEAGLRVSHPSVISTTIQYFDFVWDLAEPDEIPESAFREKTKRKFYSKVYRP